VLHLGEPVANGIVSDIIEAKARALLWAGLEAHSYRESKQPQATIILKKETTAIDIGAGGRAG
jgi:hypothetical protein